MVEQILPYFTFNEYEITLLVILLVFFLIQLFFYLNYYKKPYSVVKRREKDNYEPFLSQKPKVSVIITSENLAEKLSENLPLILSQDYPDYEVIVVNDGSTDESESLLKSLQLKYPNLYMTYLPYSSDINFGHRKLAMTIGIKAAKGDILLFTEAYCKPVSNGWISSMVKELTEGKDVVLGYAYYQKSKKFFNRVARFDNHIFSMQYLSMAIKGKPYTGIYRNLAFRKHLFFDNKGFAAHLNVENGEELFVNKIVTPTNTAVALSADSFIETSGEWYSLWKQTKKSYSAIKGYFKSKLANRLFGFESFSRYLFYLIVIAAIVYGALYQHWVILGTSIFFFLLRLIIQLIVINKSAKYFCSGKFYFSLLVMDIMQPLYNYLFRTRYSRQVVSHKGRR